ncbi:MAG: CCA tRNA nucleotidyltransferase [Hyphomicrobiaceae bacterium]
MSNVPFSPPSREPQKITPGWLTDTATQAVFKALQAHGHQVRAVGGAPRNTLARTPVTDIDLATTATPDETIDAAKAAGLRCIPTGLAHGTITILSQNKTFEVTTLRQDVSTDGRRATVAFTDDWQRDACRRDFTINAIYVAADGTIFDPVGGVADLRQSRVRFIGEPQARIREDYLRILRFFRFTGQFAQGAIDAGGLAACQAEREGLQNLSAERVRSELLRLLVTPKATQMVEAMAAADLFAQLLSLPIRIDHFNNLVAIEEVQSLEPDGLRRLASFGIRDEQDASKLSRELRLSNDEKARLLAIGRNQATPPRGCREADLHSRLYRIGIEAYRDSELLNWARSGDDPTSDWRFQRVDLADYWEVPEMPVSGSDVLALGMPAGPEVGKVLSALEQWWIATGFPDDEAMVNAKLRELVHKDD